MRIFDEAVREIKSGAFGKRLEGLYPDANDAVKRYLRLMDGYAEIFGKPNEIGIYSAPGRTEIGGNHTDHQNGCVLAASVDVDAVGVCAPNGTDEIALYSEGYGMSRVSLTDLDPNPDAYGEVTELIRGMAAGAAALGYEVKGFNAFVSSDVLSGSGLSSSAAFEVLVGVAINQMFCGGELKPIKIAQIGQDAENRFYGKPCGLMDQAASAIGGVVAIDFRDVEEPKVEKICANFEDYALCMIDSGADHAGLTDAYAAIRREMEEVAAYFGKPVLRELPKEEFLKEFAKVRESAGDRAVLRALHFYEDNDRAQREAAALKDGRLKDFLADVNASGRSSFMYLQNITPPGSEREQAVAVTLALCDEFLDKDAAFRVHGGGFAGTVQVFLSKARQDEFMDRMNRALNRSACRILSIRNEGGVEII